MLSLQKKQRASRNSSQDPAARRRNDGGSKHIVAELNSNLVTIEVLNTQEIFCVLFEFFPEKNRSRNLAQIEKLNIWWARSQYRRTFCQLPFQITIYDPSEQPYYQKIAEKHYSSRNLDSLVVQLLVNLTQITNQYQKQLSGSKILVFERCE